AVEGGVVAGDGQAQAARPGDHAERRAGGQVEAVDQGGGVQRVAVDDQGVGGPARVPDLPVEPRPGQGGGAVGGGASRWSWRRLRGAARVAAATTAQVVRWSGKRSRARALAEAGAGNP